MALTLKGVKMNPLSSEFVGLLFQSRCHRHANARVTGEVVDDGRGHVAGAENESLNRVDIFIRGM